MKAATQNSYGAPDVLTIVDIDRPAIADDAILVQVHASPVTQGDRRLRSSDFPGISWLPGRLMMGLFRPKNPVPGTMFAGRVVAVGGAVTRFTPGDDVFGSCEGGAHAEYLTVLQDGPVATMPAGLSYEEAAAVPYGAGTALTFLGELGQLQRGQRVLILGASGGVGRYAVQLAKHLGADVTGVCSGRNFELVRGLGADHVIDYSRDDFTADGQRYDLILDTIGATRFDLCRGSLTDDGRYLSLIVSLRLIFHMAMTSLFGDKKAILGVAMGNREQIVQVRELIEAGALRPVIDRRFPLARIADAHAYLESVHPSGDVVVSVATPVLLAAK